jgi:hypothetical protein
MRLLGVRLGLAALLLASGSGCAHRVAISSDPMGAQVRRGRHDLEPTPTEVLVWSIPFSRPRLELTMPGYRPMLVELRKDKKPMRRAWELLTFRYRRALALVPNGHHEVIMVPAHGPAGTWTSHDVPD